MKNIFSIITTTYNSENKIEKTLQSVVCQNDELYKYIIIDGNSEDNTVEIIKYYQTKYPDNILYISESDKGIYDGMNKGIDLARGEYLYFLGAGDTLKKGVLEKVIKELNYKPELVYGNVFWERGGYIINGKFNKERICYANLCHQSIFYHKNVFEIVGKYDLGFPIYADSFLNLKCFGNSNIKKKYIDLIIANYEGGGISTKNTDDTFIDNKENIILQFLGRKYFDMYKASDCKVWLNPNFKEIISKETNINVAIFGSAGFGKEVYKYLSKINKKENKNIEVRFFLDNAETKWGQDYCDKKIIKPNIDKFNNLNYIIIASMPGKLQIEKQLKEMGVSAGMIISAV